MMLQWRLYIGAYNCTPDKESKINVITRVHLFSKTAVKYDSVLALQFLD